jgi:ABC-type uncharacterized transport system ATPase subunit
MKGRNRYKKICFKCGKMVPANEGYLKTVKGEYYVHHIEECNPKFDMKAWEKNPIQPGSNKNKEKVLEKKTKTKSISLMASTPKIKVIDEPEVEVDPEILGFLESELKKRQLMGQPIIMLPKVIAYIKHLKATVEKLSSGEIV